MKELKILKYPHPFLKKKAKKVGLTNINDSLRETIKLMFDAMYENEGGGLAATQVGIDMRFFIMGSSENTDDQLVAINPEIIARSGEIYDEEGCLSFPGVTAKVLRSELVTLKAINENGEEYTIDASGYSSRCIQHEIDHLDGITYFDHLSALKRKMIEKKYSKLMNEAV